MRSRVVSALSLVLILPPSIARAGSWTLEQSAAMEKIMDLRNKAQDDEAMKLAEAEFAAGGASRGYRRAVAREGKVAAENVFMRDASNPERLAAANAALCVAVDLMRVYTAELIESDEDRVKIPAELARLQGLAVRARAPCAPPPSMSTTPSPASDPGPAPRRSRARIAAGAGFAILGTGLLAGMTAALVSRRNNNDRISALDDLATQENRELTQGELADVARWDDRYVRLENAGKTLGVVAGVSLLAAVIVFAVPPQRRDARARLQPAGAGIRLAF